MAILTYPYTKSLRAYPVSFCGLGGEQGKIIPIDISWDVANNYQNEEVYEITLLATEKGSQLPRVVSVYIDNGFFNGTTSVKCMDTGQVVTLIGYHKGWFTLLTNGFQFQIIRDAMQYPNTPKNTCQYIFTNAIVAPSESDTSYITAIANAVQNIYTGQEKLVTALVDNFKNPIGSTLVCTNLSPTRTMNIIEPSPGKIVTMSYFSASLAYRVVPTLGNGYLVLQISMSGASLFRGTMKDDSLLPLGNLITLSVPLRFAIDDGFILTQSTISQAGNIYELDCNYVLTYGDAV